MRFLCVPLLFVCACNQPPEGGDVSISPATPLTGDDLVAAVSADATDPNKKDEVTYAWSWSVDGVAVDDLTGDTVPADRTSKGQVWAVTVEPSDGKEAGASFTTSATVGNTPPSASNLTISPDVVTVADTLTATYDLADVDGDAPTGTVTWMANGTTVGTGDTLALSGVTKGDAITASLVPNDGSDDGEAITSAPVMVLNSAPSVPVAMITPDAPWLTDPLVCGLATPSTDADGDDVTYSVVWTVGEDTYKGASTTNIEGDTVPAGAMQGGQMWSCTLYATDGEETIASAPSAAVTLTPPDGVTYQAGYYWVKADFPATRSDHATVCAEVGLNATANEVNLTWDEDLVDAISDGFAMTSLGKAGCCATAMWCWEGGENPYEPTAVDGTCHTHNFGEIYTNYGTYTPSEFERPVFTCTTAIQKER